MKPPETFYRGERLSGPRGEMLGVKVLADDKPLSPKRSHRVSNHSPDGFEWGYGGSGPAQLALALLLDATDSVALARRYYQRYKWAAVSSWGQVWQTTAAEILAWVRRFEAEDLEEGQRQAVRRCRVCGCSAVDYLECVQVLGERCQWVESEPDLCSRCFLQEKGGGS